MPIPSKSIISAPAIITGQIYANSEKSGLVAILGGVGTPKIETSSISTELIKTSSLEGHTSLAIKANGSNITLLGDTVVLKATEVTSDASLTLNKDSVTLKSLNSYISATKSSAQLLLNPGQYGFGVMVSNPNVDITHPILINIKAPDKVMLESKKNETTNASVTISPGDVQISSTSGITLDAPNMVLRGGLAPIFSKIPTNWLTVTDAWLFLGQVSTGWRRIWVKEIGKSPHMRYFDIFIGAPLDKSSNIDMPFALGKDTVHTVYSELQMNLYTTEPIPGNFTTAIRCRIVSTSGAKYYLAMTDLR